VKAGSECGKRTGCWGRCFTPEGGSEKPVCPAASVPCRVLLPITRLQRSVVLYPCFHRAAAAPAIPSGPAPSQQAPSLSSRHPPDYMVRTSPTGTFYVIVRGWQPVLQVAPRAEPPQAS